MRTYPIPFNEESRLSALHDIPGLVAADDAVFESICDAARKLLGCPIAHISVIEDEVQWYKAVVGIDLEQMERNKGFCSHTIMSNAPLIVPDLSKDPRFKKHPMVVSGGPEARFYAGVPLVLSSGYCFGALCAIDLVAHESPSDTQIEILEDLGRVVVAAMEGTPPERAETTEAKLAKENFVKLVSHELKTPLTVLNGSMKLLEVPSDTLPKEAIARSARKSIESLVSLVDHIITYSNFDIEEIAPISREANLLDILQEISDLVLPDSDGTPKSAKLDESVTSLPIYLDEDQIKLALNALLLNSVNHGGENITFSVARDEDANVEICLSDNGTLSDRVELEKLYEPFIVGGDIDNRDTRGGLGLGLPLTRKIIEMHGGEFEVRAEPGLTTAVIRLPEWRTDLEWVQVDASAVTA